MTSDIEQREPDTIFAIATPPGFGGVGVIRVSGRETATIAERILGRIPRARYATLCNFMDGAGQTIDSGIALLFPAPASFTGEDVLELQGHGGPVVQQLLSQRVMELGARPARPGEFLERAFLNDKLDLTQAEAIDDLIESGTTASARAAQRSLEGAFSGRVNEIQDRLTSLRVFVEAALDFPDEEIDFIGESDIGDRLDVIVAALDRLLAEAHQGRLLRDGITVAIIGMPNAGKSSLLNALAGRDTAIVTDIPGTTRDVLRETLSMDGLPVHIADTAGIREADNVVEAEGVRRARLALSQADLVLLILDTAAPLEPQLELEAEIPAGISRIHVHNKIDLAGAGRPGVVQAGEGEPAKVFLSAQTGEGIGALSKLIRETAGLAAGQEGSFSARTRHLDALRRTRAHVVEGGRQLADMAAAETLAEELRLAQRSLGEITGQFLPDDLLGEIFASFCIGK
jgi:tRNA modification GTPase